MSSYHSNGKLLLTSEYLILNGAWGLALPLILGQHLELEMGDKKDYFEWEARYKDRIWLNATFNTDKLEPIYSSDPEKIGFLQSLLQAASELAPAFTSGLKGIKAVSRLDFDPRWGLGSSSTLIHLLAQWANVDPYELHFRVANGSGYDIACAGANSALEYRKKGTGIEYRTVAFKPAFADNLWFAWLGRKEKSAENVERYMQEIKPGAGMLDVFSELSRRFYSATSLEEFGGLILRHESLMGELLGRPTIRETLFTDLEGWVKSLGAWGGDFVMIASPLPAEKLLSYLAAKGLTTVFNYNQLVKNE